MNLTQILRHTLWCLLEVAALVSTTPARAVLPEHTMENAAVHLKGFGPDNPILYHDDWWFDVFEIPKAAAPLQASREEFFSVMTQPNLSQ